MSSQFFNDILQKNRCKNVERMVLQPEISPVGVEQIKPGAESVQFDNDLNTFTKAEQIKKTETKINTLQIGSATTREMKPFPRKSSVEENHYKVFEKYFEQNCTIENLNTENENLQIENQQLKATNNELKEENIRLTREIERLKAEVVEKDETIRLSTEIDGPTPHQLNTNGKITKDGNKGNKKDKEKDKTPSTNLDNKMDPYFPYPMIDPFATLQITGYRPPYSPTELLARGIPIPPGYPFMHPPTALDATWRMRNLRVNEENLMSQSPEKGNGSYGEVGNRRSFYGNVEHERTPNMSAATTNNRHRTSNHPLFSSKTRGSFKSHPSPPTPFGGDDEMLIKIDGPTPHQHNTDGKITRDGSKGNKKDKEKDKISSTNLDKRGNSSSPRSSAVDRSNQWHCKYCTYSNDQQENICAMCGRTKNKGAEATPMKTGGKICSRCTLVNDAKARQCAACNHHLHGCAIYLSGKGE